jgi:hypothetical protein
MALLLRTVTSSRIVSVAVIALATTVSGLAQHPNDAGKRGANDEPPAVRRPASELQRLTNLVEYWRYLGREGAQRVVLSLRYYSRLAAVDELEQKSIADEVEGLDTTINQLVTQKTAIEHRGGLTKWLMSWIRPDSVSVAQIDAALYHTPSVSRDSARTDGLVAYRDHLKSVLRDQAVESHNAVTAFGLVRRFCEELNTSNQFPALKVPPLDCDPDLAGLVTTPPPKETVSNKTTPTRSVLDSKFQKEAVQTLFDLLHRPRLGSVGGDYEMQRARLAMNTADDIKRKALQAMLSTLGGGISRLEAGPMANFRTAEELSNRSAKGERLPPALAKDPIVHGLIGTFGEDQLGIGAEFLKAQTREDANQIVAAVFRTRMANGERLQHYLQLYASYTDQAHAQHEGLQDLVMRLARETAPH